MRGICPRCGKPGGPAIHRISGREYLYYDHYDPERRKRIRCYIGPTDGYVAVARLHDIHIPRAFSIEHKLEILEQLLDYFAETCKYIPSDGDEEDEKTRKACAEAKELVEEFLQNTQTYESIKGEKE